MEDQVRGEAGPDVGSAHIRRLTEELAGVARETAQLLLNPRYDEAELAELDVRARQLRAAIRETASGGDAEPEPVQAVLRT